MNGMGKYLILSGVLAQLVSLLSLACQAAPPTPILEPHKSVITINQPPETLDKPPAGQVKNKLQPVPGKDTGPIEDKVNPNKPPAPSLAAPGTAGISPSSLQRQIKNPALLSEIRQNLFVDILSLSAHPQADQKWTWSVQLKNNGPTMIAAGRLQVKVVQKLLSGTDLQAGAPLPSIKTLVSKEVLSLSRSHWTKTPMTKQLVCEVRDSKTNQIVASKSLSLPVFSGPEKKAVTPAAKKLSETTLAAATPDPRFDYSINSAEYLGQGRFQATIRNDGNIKIAANRLRVSGRYFMGPEDILVPRIIEPEIMPDQTATVEVMGLLSDGECYNLTSIDVNVTDPDTGKDRYKDLRVHHLNNSVTFTDVSFNQGFLTASLQNTAPYGVKLKIKVKDVEIWDIAKPYKNSDGNLLEQAWDFMTGGAEFDSSGLQPEEHQCTAHNILITPIELSAGGMPQVSPTWSVPVSALQNAIQAQCPDADFSRYSQVYKNLRLQVYTENIAHCPASKVLDTHLTAEGGRNESLFSW